MSDDVAVAEMLAWLQDNCLSIHLDMNEHKDVYQTTAEAIEEIELAEGMSGGSKDDAWPGPEELARCLAADRIWRCQVYPDTPVGFYYCHAATLEAAIKPVYEAVRKSRHERP